MVIVRNKLEVVSEEFLGSKQRPFCITSRLPKRKELKSENATINPEVAASGNHSEISPLDICSPFYWFPYLKLALNDMVAFTANAIKGPKQEKILRGYVGALSD
jgi:hypothetical protein